MRLKRAFLVCIGVILYIFISTGYNQPSFENKISDFVWDAMQSKSPDLSVFVVLKKQANLDTKSKLSNAKQFVYNSLRIVAATSQQDLIYWLSKKGLKFQRFYIVNMVAVFNADSKTIVELAKRNDVSKLLLNPKTNALPQINKSRLAPKDAREGPEPNIVSTGADKVWSELKIKGEGIVVAGQDTGVQWDHPALKAHYRGYNNKTGEVDHNYNWHDAIHEHIKPLDGHDDGDDGSNNKCGYDISAPCDDNEHGSHTMGTIVGDDGKGNQIGMAPGAKWIACRNMDAGVGRPSTYIECFEWFLAPYPFGGDPLKDGDPSKAPNVINNSWGCPEDEGCHDAEILPVLKSLKKAGIMVVASAGNEGPDCGTIQDPPAFHSEETLSVGAYDHRNGKIAFFSSRGPSKFDGGIGPDVVAPGVGIRSSVPGSEYSGFLWSGTSMAGPHVVGEVALLWSFDNSLIGKIDDTVKIIRLTSTPTKSEQTCGDVPGDQIPNNVFGWGTINAYKAAKSRINVIKDNN